MANVDRRARAEARLQHATLRRTSLSAVAGDEDDVLTGADAISLVTRLTRESFSLAGLEPPRYARRDTPCVFVPYPGR